MKKVETTNKF